MKSMRNCQSTTVDGRKCKSPPQIGIEYCFFHNPTNSSERQVASSKGGKRGKISTLTRQTPDQEVKSAQDVVNLLSESVNQVRRGEIDPRIANAIGYLSGIILKAREQSDLEERLNDLESALNSSELEDKKWH